MKLRVEIDVDKRTPKHILTIDMDGDDRDAGSVLARLGLLTQTNGAEKAFQLFREHHKKAEKEVT